MHSRYSQGQCVPTLHSVAWADWHIAAPGKMDDLSVRKTAVLYSEAERRSFCFGLYKDKHTVYPNTGRGWLQTSHRFWMTLDQYI